MTILLGVKSFSTTLRGTLVSFQVFKGSSPDKDRSDISLCTNVLLQIRFQSEPVGFCPRSVVLGANIMNRGPWKTLSATTPGLEKTVNIFCCAVDLS